jgi:hypothetical protein
VDPAEKAFFINESLKVQACPGRMISLTDQMLKLHERCYPKTKTFNGERVL